jgi:N-glycosylase/DNA lyase
MSESFLKNYAKVKKIIKSRLKEFSNISSKKEVFYELCFCVLTPQNNAKGCAEAIEILRKNNFYGGEMNSKKISDILKNKTRFYKNKTRYLCDLRKSFEEMWKTFDFKRKNNGLEARVWIVDNIKGIGYKESSHFLRNVGFRNLAILDRHILKNLFKVGVLNEKKSFVGKKEYFLIEKAFLNFGEKSKIEMDELDLYFWYLETGEVFK